jgi:RNase P/RNase MRP subunit p30
MHGIDKVSIPRSEWKARRKKKRKCIIASGAIEFHNKMRQVVSISSLSYIFMQSIKMFWKRVRKFNE